MSERKGEMIEMRPSGGNRLRLVFHAPTRGLIGYLGELLTDTRGTAIMNRLFHSWGPWKGEIAGRRNGDQLAPLKTKIEAAGGRCEALTAASKSVATRRALPIKPQQ